MNDAISDDGALSGARALICGCANTGTSDDVAIISDHLTRDVGEAIKAVAKGIARSVVHLTIAPLSNHGQEPPEEITAALGKATVGVGVTRKSLLHTDARRRASANGCRYLSLPEYSMDVLRSPAMAINFQDLTPLSRRLAAVFTTGERLHLRTQRGTRLDCRIEGRRGNAAPGTCYRPGEIASPPDSESNVALIEDQSEGIVVVDGSIPCDELGLLDEPLTLIVEKGRVVDIKGPKKAVLSAVFDDLGDSRTRVLGEFGVGLNPNARVCGCMLEDEGCLGTVHLGIGSNITFGGENDIPFHLDHVIRDATVEVDGRCILDDGRIVEHD